MVFSSLIFIYLFLPAVVIAYFAARGRGRNIVLLIFSLLFYAWGEPVCLFLMLFSIAMNYAFGRRIIPNKNARR